MKRRLFRLFRVRSVKPEGQSVKPPARAIFPIDTQLEHRQEIARRILVADGKNIDRPLTEDQPVSFIPPANVPEDFYPIG